MRVCRGCATPLTDDEQPYLGGRCEQCETEWNARVEKWRRGGGDLELDRMYGAARDATH